MRKILIVLPNDSLGGAEQILKMIAFYYKDYEVEVCFLKYEKSSGWDDFPSHIRLHYQNGRSEYSGMVRFILRTLFRKRVEYQYIFTSHVLVTGIVGVLVRLRLIKKLYFIGRESTQVFDRFSGLKLFLYRKMYELGYSNIDLLICQTENMKSGLLKNLPWIESKVKTRVINNPINLSRIPTIEENNDSFEYIISAGRLIPEKGFDILIYAFKSIVEFYPKYKLIILGEGKCREELQSQIKYLDLEDKVELRGFVSNVYPYFKNSKACVVASRIEGFPNVLLQMMSQNHKVVSTKCAGGIDEIEGVFTAETNDVESLKQAMLLAFEQDTSKNRLVFDSFLEGRSIDNFVSKIETFINE